MINNGSVDAEKPPPDVDTTSSRSKLAFPIEGADNTEYDPWKHRDQYKVLGTAGALFHMVKGSLGSGILSMPVAFKNGGLWVSLVGAIVIGLICTHCVQILVRCSHELSRRVKQPSLAYAATAEMAFETGPLRLRKYSVLVREIVDNSLMISYYFAMAVYILYIASAFKSVIEANFDLNLSTRYYVVIMTVIIVPVASIRYLKDLVPFSFIAIIFLLIGCGSVLYEVFLDLPPISSRPAFSNFQNLPLFYSTMLFAIEGIGTVLPIENAMKNPRYFLGCPGVLNTAMTILVTLYSLIGFLGYWRYGNNTEANITLNLSSSLIGEIVKILVALNVLFSYGLCFCVPCESVWRKLEPRISEKRKTLAHYSMRIILSLGTLIIAFALPDLEPFVGLVGAICYSTLGLLFPSVIELVTFWSDRKYMGPGRWKLYKNLFLILMWLVALTAGTESSINSIIESLSESS